MTSAQLRASRALLKWTVRRLAEEAGVHRNTVSNYETGRFVGDAATMSALRSALTGAGVIFLDDGQCIEGGPGVRLRKE